MNGVHLLESRHLRIALGGRGSGIRGLVDVATGRDFAAPGDRPLYTLVLSGADGGTRETGSADAATVAVERPTARSLAFAFTGHGSLDLTVRCTVELPEDSPDSSWRMSIENRTAYGVRAIRFPVTVVPTPLGVRARDTWFLWGLYGGQLVRNPALPARRSLRDREPPLLDEGEREARYDTAVGAQYPGVVAVQLQAYGDGGAGLSMATHDDLGTVKTFGCAWAGADDLLDLTIAHHPDERPGAAVELAYPTVLGVFDGDWYAAADRYKAWAEGRPWCARRLAERTDLPRWITEPRPSLVAISRGNCARGMGALFNPPSEYPIGKFWPARRAAAVVRRYARALKTPVVAWMEGWEKIGSPGGPVDIFPPLEGERSFRRAMARIRRAGHIVFLYIAGFSWCFRRASVGYDGWDRFLVEGRRLAAVNERGGIDTLVYPNTQKHFVPLCHAAPGTRELFAANLARLQDLGGTSLQMDQQTGMFLTVCYSREHGHPPGYGPWMHESMREFLGAIRRQHKGRDPESTFSYEGVCELWMQQVDCHMYRPYMVYLGFVPLFAYLYHEYALFYGGDTMMGPCHPEVACMKQALVFIHGMTNMVGIGEEDYDLDVPGVEHPAIPLLCAIVRAQRTFARRYVVFGGMLKPAAVRVPSIETDVWPPIGERVLRTLVVPKVFSSSWRSPEGIVGHLFANWTGEPQPVSADLPAAGNGRMRRLGDGSPGGFAVHGGTVSFTVPPRGIALLEEGTG